MTSRLKKINSYSRLLILVLLGVLIFRPNEVLPQDVPSQDSQLFLPYEILYEVGSWPQALATGDVNSDGRIDVVMTTGFYFDPENDYHIFVFLQNTSGELDPPVKYPTRGDPISIDIGDLNNDGRADVAVGNNSSNIEVFLQNEEGSLNESVSYPTSDSSSLKIGDFNNDQLLDVVGMGAINNTVSVFLQNSGGTLNEPNIYNVSYGGFNEIDVGDVDNDGLTDIIVMSGSGFNDNLGVLLQVPGGTFRGPVYYDLGGGEFTEGVAVGDINGDSREDIVVSSWHPTSLIAVFLQNDSGSLELGATYESYSNAGAIEIADVNSDGRGDVVVLHYGSVKMGVYLQDETGNLLAEELYEIPSTDHYNPQGLDIADINSDGLNDVVIANRNDGLVALYHAPLPLADLTGQWGTIELKRNLLKTTFTLENRGNKSTEDFQVNYYLSKDQTLDARDALIRVKQISILEAGESRILNLWYPYPRPLKVLKKFIIAQVDSQGQILESDEANNIITSSQIQYPR